MLVVGVVLMLMLENMVNLAVVEEVAVLQVMALLLLKVGHLYLLQVAVEVVVLLPIRM